MIIVFLSTHDAIKAKNLMDKAGFPYEVIPTPRKITAECGMSLRVEQSLLNQVLELFQAKGVRYRSDLL